MRNVRAEVRRLEAKRLARRQVPVDRRDVRPRLVAELAPEPTRKVRNDSWWRGKSNRVSSWRRKFQQILK